MLGIPATILSAVVGTSTVSALGASPTLSVQVAVGGLAIAAAILVSLQTFLDLGARAERHRIAGVRYKGIIRQVEQLGVGTIQSSLDHPVVTEIRQRLDSLEEDMPVVPPSIHKQVDAKYQDPQFVDSLMPRPYAASQPR